MINCPICRAEAVSKFRDSPYWVCPSCDCWFQWPQPPKTYIAEFEGDPAQMSDGDKAINIALADKLFMTVMGSKPGSTLDIGAKLPVLADRLARLGCSAFALDHEPIAHGLQVHSINADFESDHWTPAVDEFSLISMIHVFEHMYDPLAALRLLRQMVKDDGRVFLRVPLHDVQGFERDLTPGHYSIHPFYHSMDSILEALVQTNTFVIEKIDRMDNFGQGDIVLRPI